jgi:hypothetical protein
MKAKLAITLGKTYRQEGQLEWGYLTPPDEPKREHVKIQEGREGGGREAGRADKARTSPRKRGDDCPSTRRELVPCPDPVAACARLLGQPHLLFLDSAADPERLGRHSYLTAAPAMMLRGRARQGRMHWSRHARY